MTSESKRKPLVGDFLIYKKTPTRNAGVVLTVDDKWFSVYWFLPGQKTYNLVETTNSYFWFVTFEKSNDTTPTSV